jgi:hypothetical protein
MEQKHIEVFGGIAKLENLASLGDHMMPNTLVLESETPFPGYHGKNLPLEPVPNALFFVTSKYHSIEKVIRATTEIKKYFNHHFDAATGKICIYNDTYGCIRIRGLNSFDYIQELQHFYRDLGFKFKKKKTINAPAIIQLKKSFLLEDISEFILKDLEDVAMYYIHIPRQLKWKMFEKITQSVKNNLENANFDAALGSIYYQGVKDVVRVYAQDISTERLHSIRNKYIQEIERAFLD